METEPQKELTPFRISQLKWNAIYLSQPKPKPIKLHKIPLPFISTIEVALAYGKRL